MATIVVAGSPLTKQEKRAKFLYAVSYGLEHFAWPAVMLVVIELLMLGCAQAGGLPPRRPRGFCQR